MGVTVEALIRAGIPVEEIAGGAEVPASRQPDLIRAGIPAEEIVTVEAGDDPADAWPMGLKRGPVRTAPVAVVAARSAETVSLVLRAAAAAGATVQVEGAGTNVVGCLDGAPDLVLRLAMDRIVDFDTTSQVVTVEAGVIGGILEGFLNDRGFTLGHYPQSLHHSTVGGWIATRATGTASARFGGLEQMVRGLEGVLPSGQAFKIGVRPRSPGGLDVMQLLTGTEGSLAVITAASLAVARLMPEVKLNGLVPDFATGLEVQRELIQRAVPVGVVRLLNPAETAAVLVDAPDSAGACLLVLSLVGEPAVTGVGQRIATDAIGAAGGSVLGPDAADRWWDNRHAGPELIQGLNRDAGSFFDTIELGVPWRSAAALAAALQSEVGELADRLWMHSSHIYSTGTGLYLAFWIDAPDDDSACARAEAVWACALDLADRHGGTIGHHHGIGAARSARYLQSVEGRLHQSVKRALDPEGVLAARLLDG